MSADPRALLHRIDLDGADRLTAALMRAFEIGIAIDPHGSGAGQLQSLGPSLEHLHQDLRTEVLALSEPSDISETRRNDLRLTLERLISEVAKLRDAASASAS